MNVFTLLAYGPLCGVTKQRPDVVHAITLESGLHGCTNGKTVEAACGKKRVFFLSTEDDRVLLWPPYDKGPLTRCRDCWVATGKKRPRRAS